MSKSLIAFDTDHIKSYVFGTNKLKEIRGASSLLDKLNRVETVKEAEKLKATKIYAHGGSALFVIDSNNALSLGQAVQKLYHERTGGGASITYAIQPLPVQVQDTQVVMTLEKLSENVTMKDMLKLLSFRLRLAKDNLHMDTLQTGDTQAELAMAHIASPSHAFLCTCESCGVAYAQHLWGDPDDLEDEEGRYCRICIGKREEDRSVKNALRKKRRKPLSAAKLSFDATLWERIQHSLGDMYFPEDGPLPGRPKDFNVFGDFTHGKAYLGLIYADANSMGKALQELPSLQKLQEFANTIDNAVFAAMGHAIQTHLPVQDNLFPFDILLVGGDDIVMVTPADKAMQIAQTLGEKFLADTGKYTLSIGVVLAPVKYPFGLQYKLVDETIKAAKKQGAKLQKGLSDATNASELTRINFVVVTGNTSLGYQKQYSEMYREKTPASQHEFYATLRPYTLSDFSWLLQQLKTGNQKRLGRTKLHQLREAILKLNHTTTIIDALALLRNWQDDERNFMKQMVERFDARQSKKQEAMGPLFPWYLDGEESNDEHVIYRTPLLDFIELYDFVLS